MDAWKQYTKYLYWLGPFLIIMGVTAGLVAGSWGSIPIGLIGGGVALTLTWLVTQWSQLQMDWKRRSTQDTANAAIATIAVLAIVLTLNILADRYGTPIDLTENRIFTLAPQTQEVMQGLEQPIQVYLFEPLPNPQDRTLLENYERQNPEQFSYEYIDPQAQPGIAQRFGVQTLGEVYLEQGDRQQFVQTVSPELPLSESRLTNAIVAVTSETQPTVYFLQGHGERQLAAGQGGLSETAQNLEDENYAVNPLNLATDPTVPEDADVIVLAGPQRSLLDEELTALEDYTETQSGLMVMIDPQAEPELDEFLAEWGVIVGDRILFEPAAGQDGVVTVITQYGQHPITAELGNGISFYPLAVPLQIEEVEGVQATPLLLTNPDTEAREIGDDGTLLPPDGNEPQGNFILGAALSRTLEAPENAENPDAPPPEARLVVIGNSTFMTDGLVNQQLNRDVFLNSVRWLSQDEGGSLAIRPAEPENRRIVFSPGQRLWLAIASMALVPSIGFALAAVFWWRRR